jgi:hypothetical protein
MATLFESTARGGLFFDTTTSGAYGNELEFDYLLTQVGVFDSPSSDDSFFSSTLLDGASSSTVTGELSWHVDWFDSTNDIVDLNSYDAIPNSELNDQLKPSLPPATNRRSQKQTKATPKLNKKPTSKVQKGRLTEIPEPSDSESSFINNPGPSSSPQDFHSLQLTPEDLQYYSDAFRSSDIEQPATISPSLLLAPLTPPPSSPLTVSLTLTSPVQENKKDTAAMDYSFFSLNPTSELYIPNNYGYPLTPGGYLEPAAYVIDMAKSQSAPAFPLETPQKKRRRIPEALNLTTPISNKRKRSDDDDMPIQQITPEQYKRPRHSGQFTEQDPSFGSTPSAHASSTFESYETPLPETTYYHQPEFSPYDTLMSCYNDQQMPYDHYVAPQTPYQMNFQQESFHTPPVSPFETMGWYAPQRPYMQKTQTTVWNTPRTLPQQYPISPAPTPQKKQKDLRRLSLAPQPPRMQYPYPLSPPNSAPPYPVTQQHLLPKLDHHDIVPATPTKKEGKKGRKGKNAGGGMFINFTADDRDTILSGVAPSGSSKAKKDKK